MKRIVEQVEQRAFEYSEDIELGSKAEAQEGYEQGQLDLINDIINDGEISKELFKKLNIKR